jgi:hypothetical protein
MTHYIPDFGKPTRNPIFGGRFVVSRWSRHSRGDAKQVVRIPDSRETDQTAGYATIHTMNQYGPIQKVLVRDSVFDLEDKIVMCEALANRSRGEADVASIDQDVAAMRRDLDRMRPLLAR